MHASALVLAAFLPSTLLSIGSCAVPASEAQPTRATPGPASTATDTEPAPQPSVRAAFERVLELVATPAAASVGWELSRIDARGVDGGVRVWMDVEVRGADEVETAQRSARLLESLRGLDGARAVAVRSSFAKDPSWLRLSGVSLELDAPAVHAGIAAADGTDFESSIRTLSVQPEIRLGGVEIERRTENSWRVSAHAPAGGQRLDNLRLFLSELEERHPRTRVVLVSLKSAWKAGAEPAPDPLRFHWQIDVERRI